MIFSALNFSQHVKLFLINLFSIGLIHKLVPPSTYLFTIWYLNIISAKQLNQYQGLENKQNVVIKSEKNNIFFHEPLKFKSEIDELIRFRYKNLVMLLGDFAEGTHRLLVYEYVCNGFT